MDVRKSHSTSPPYLLAGKCLCGALTGYAAVGGDCADGSDAVHPGATEICNGKDDNCDGKIDEGFDQDNDGTPSCARLAAQHK